MHKIIVVLIIIIAAAVCITCGIDSPFTEAIKKQINEDIGIGQETPETFVVNYDGNGNTGGSVPVDKNLYEEGQDVSVFGNPGGLVKTGHFFTGWNTEKDDSGETYTQGQTFVMGTANITLYARWTTNPVYSVIYYGNESTNGFVPEDTTYYEEGQTVTILGNSGGLLKTGHTFIGWNTQEDGLGTSYTEGQTFPMGSADVKLYADWTVNSYTVTYYPTGASGGDVPADSTDYEYGTTVEVLGNTGNLIKTGYTFDHWNTQSNGLGWDYFPEDTFTLGASDVSLYPRWAINSYTFSYHGNNAATGDVPAEPASYNYQASVTILGNTGNLAKTGYTFVGWNTETNGSGATYTTEQTFTMGAEDEILYAKWANIPTITATASVSEIMATTAKSGGEITSDGGDSVTVRGVCCR